MSEPTVFVQTPTVAQPPEMALFMGADPPYDPGRAHAESDGLRAALAGLGVRSLVPSEVLADLSHDVLVALAAAATTVPDERRGAALASLERWSPEDLVAIVLRQPELVLESDPTLATISPDSDYERYVVRPLFGLMFPRDHYVDVGDDALVGRLLRKDRERETAVVQAVLAHVLGRAPSALAAPMHLEGGDVVAYGDVALVGVGFRSDADAFDALRPRLAAAHRHVVRLEDRLRRPGEFHLDHWIALGPGVALVAADRLDDADAVHATVATAHGACGGGTVRRALTAVGVEVAALDADAVAAFAANVFFVPGRRAALVSSTCLPAVGDVLERWEIETVAVPFDEHHKQFGSIHCAVNTVPVGAARSA